MGYGSLMSCMKCQKNYQLFTGCGMEYFLEYKRLMAQIRKGKFGPKMQKIVLDDDFVAVDAEQKLYVCDKCGYWNVEKACHLYKPKSRAAVIQNQIDKFADDEFFKSISYDEEKNEIRTVDGVLVPLSRVFPEVYLWGENRKNYTRILKVNHQCAKCSEIMRETNEDEKVELKCPDCGGDMWESGSVCWD